MTTPHSTEGLGFIVAVQQAPVLCMFECVCVLVCVCMCMCVSERDLGVDAGSPS